MQIRIGFIVFQQNIVLRPVLFDQRLFKQQRLGLAGGNRHFNMMNVTDQRYRFTVKATGTEVTGYTILEVLCLADIEQFTIGSKHTVNPGALRQGFKEGFDVKIGHF